MTDISLVIFITVCAAFVASLAQLLFKRNLGSELGSFREVVALVRNKYIVIGELGYLASLVMYLYGLKLSGEQLSLVYPTFASTFIFVIVISVLFLKERVGPLRVFGTLLVFAGIVIIAVSGV